MRISIGKTLEHSYMFYESIICYYGHTLLSLIFKENTIFTLLIIHIIIIDILCCMARFYIYKLNENHGFLLSEHIDIDAHTSSQHDIIFSMMYRDAENENLTYEYEFMENITRVDPRYFIGSPSGNYHGKCKQSVVLYVWITLHSINVAVITNTNCCECSV